MNMNMNNIGKPTRLPSRSASIAALLVCLFIGGPIWANNIEVTRVKRFGKVAGSHWMVQFDVAWTNSWRCDLAGAGQAEPYNYDAAWVFVKWRTNDPSAGVTSLWYHASLSTNASDHIAPAGSTIEVGRNGRVGEWGTKGIGVFIHRNANGDGAFKANNARVQWNYAQDGVADNAKVELKVCAIEMVYVPQGAFYLGSSNGTAWSEAFRFYAGGYPDTPDLITTPFLVTNENYQIDIKDEVGSLYYDAGGGDQTGVLSNAFPKGFGAFYGMKYEITQGQYVDFLNTLTRLQQGIHCMATTLNMYMYHNGGQTTPANRNGIQVISDPGGDYTGPNPRTYANNLDTGNAPNSTNDGQWIACNWLAWEDLTAYLDWAGLRPMSELEFEKACRGTNYPVNGARPWGTADFIYPTNVINSGTAYEAPQPDNANLLQQSSTVIFQGPLRVGCFGTASSGDRVRAGAGYYGMMEMAGNVVERIVSVAEPAARIFTGQNGDGTLGFWGDAPVAVLLWPAISAAGTGYLGGAWNDGWYGLQSFIANRQYVSAYNAGREAGCGGRGVRTAP